MSVTIKLRRGTSLEWTNSSPNVVLSLGEPGFETDTHKLKIGDGTTAWNSLDYVSDGFSGVGGPLDYTYEEDGDNDSFVANNPSGITNLKINPISHNVDFSPYYDDLIDNSYSINITLTKVEDADKAILFSCQNITDMTSGAHPYYSFDVAELSRSTLFTGFETDKKYYLNIDIKGQNFPELTEDKINSLIVAGSGIYKDYDDAADPATLTISVSGLDSSYISDFSSAVSGLLPVQIASVDLHNGGVVTAQVLQFNDDSQQSVITGPTPPSGNSSQRIIIQGQRAQGGGEGGDVYVWGGDSDANGGDIKIYAGDADNVSPDSGYGGYVNIDGGKGASGGGDVEITGGYSAGGQAGDVIIAGGTTSSGVAGVVNINSNNGNWVFGADGGLTLPRGGIITDDIETVTLSGAGTVGVNQTYRKVAAGVYVGTTNYLYQIEPREAPSTGYQVRLTTLSPPGYYESEDLITWTIVSGENGGVSPVPTGVVVPPNITLSVDSSSWAFGGDGNLTFPDGSIQTTAPTVIDVVQGSGINVTSSSGTFTVGVSGLDSSYISDFSSSVSGLLPVKSVVQGSGVSVTSSSGVFTVGVSGLDASYISDFSSAVSGLLPTLSAGSGIGLTAGSGNSITIGCSGIASFTQLYPKVVNLSVVSSTISTDASAGQIFNVALTSSATLSNPTNPIDGVTLRWRIQQDAYGSHTVTLDNKFQIPTSATSPLPFSTAPYTIDLLAATYNSANDNWDIIAFVMGY